MNLKEIVGSISARSAASVRTLRNALPLLRDGLSRSNK